MPKILIVDDASFFRKRTEKLLQKYNIEAILAENGAEAIKKYKEFNPDMVFMDITMPEIDGITATKRIREFDPEAKICMLSCMGQDHIRISATQAGAIDFLEKPYTEEQMMDIVKKVLG